VTEIFREVIDMPTNFCDNLGGPGEHWL